jgi:hypothetical protein
MVISFSIYLGALNKDEFWRWNAAQEDGEWRPGLMFHALLNMAI